jgi:phage-related minor tail protein
MNPANQLIGFAETFGEAFSESFKGIVTGSMSAQQALANLFQRTADHFLDMAAQMIAAQIKMKILGIGLNFLGGGLGGGGASAVPSTAYGDFSVAGPSFFSGGMIPGFANGGRPPVGRPSIVGERGPELFVPDRTGTIVPNHAMGSANVVVNVDASGSSVEGDADQAQQLGKAIGIAVQQELVKQKRPGGLLAR